MAVADMKGGSVQVLVVDDDTDVRDSLRRALAFEGYDVVTAADGAGALDQIRRARPDVVVLDVQMPGLDGLETCRLLRATGTDVPVLMLTARAGTPDRVTGLDAGADDYLSKPFALEELLARLRALLRRSGTGGTGGASPQVLAFDDLRLDTVSREVTRAGRAVMLTRTEHELLELLLRHPRQVLPRARILREVWGHDVDPASNTLDVYVGYLRRKTEEHNPARLIHTVRGIGFALRAADR